jgi:hypothetical protein
MRKSLWIIPVLFAAIVTPYANADSIADPTVIIKFECCDGAKVAINDLEITFTAPITRFGSNLTGCTETGKGTGTVAVTCKNGIPVGKIVSTLEVSDGNFALASWTDANDARVATATPTTITPTPEPATGGLILLGFGMLMLMRNAQRSRRAT